MPTVLALAGLLACAPQPPPVDDPTCPRATTVVAGDLQAAIDAASTGDVLHVPPGTYGAVRVATPVKLVGVREDGACAGPYGQGGPTLAGLTLDAKGAGAQGLQVDGAVALRAPAMVRDLFVRGAETCVTATAAVSIERLAAVGCGEGVVLSGGAELWHAIVAGSRDDGVRVAGLASVAHLTTVDNGRHGLVNTHPDARLFDVLSVGNGGWGFYEEQSAQARVAFAFQGNGEGMYGHATVPPRHLPIELPREGETFFLLLPHDRTVFALPLETDGIRRVHALTARPIPPRATAPLTPETLVAAVTPSKPMIPAEPMRSAFGLPTTPQALDPRVGAVESGTLTTRPSEPLWVSVDGDDAADGTLATPLRTIQAAVDRAPPFQEIRVLPGTYEESVFVRDTTVVLRGFAPSDAGPAPLTDPRDPRLPVIDPSATGRPEQGLFLADVGPETRVEGLAFAGAMTNVTVIGLATDPPTAPTLRALRIEGGRKGLDTDQTEGTLVDSIVRDNAIGAVFRAVSGWRVEGVQFEDNDVSITMEFTLAGPYRDFEVRGCTFTDGPVILDVVNAWRGSRYLFADNVFEDVPVVVHAGFPAARVVLSHNAFRGPLATLTLDGDAWAMPTVTTELNSATATPPGHTEGLGWTGVHAAMDAWTFTPPEADYPPTGFQPEDRQIGPHTSPIVRTADGAEVWAVAADFGGVSVFDATQDGAPLGFVATGRDPRGLALTPDGSTVLVANLGAGTVSFVDRATRAVVADVEVGVEPFGVAVAPDGAKAYVTVGAEGAIVRLDVATRAVDGRLTGLPIKPRGIAIWGPGGGTKLFVTHFTPEDVPTLPRSSLDSHQAVLTVVDLPAFSRPRRVRLPAIASERFPDAVPTLMQAIVPRGDRLYLPSFGANPHKPTGEVRHGRALMGFETTIQGLLTVVDAVTEQPIAEESANLSTPGNPLSGPYHVTFTPDDDVAFVTTYGNDVVSRFLVRAGAEPVPIYREKFAVDLLTGSNPRGAVYDADRDRLYTVDFASATVTVIDVTAESAVNRVPLGPPERDKLSADGRVGKVLFYAANRVSVAANFWITCGTCHPDGRTDGVTWAFDPGPRSTPALASSLWTLPLHFDADRDEVDDFEHTIRDLQGGFALAKGDPYPALGPKLSDRETPWKAVRAYLAEGIDSPRGLPESPQSERGREVFRELGCTTCHGGAYFTSSALPDAPTIKGPQMIDSLRDVGTKRPTDLLREHPGFDPPSLWGVHQTGPYLHDGAAPTLLDAFTGRKHLLAGAPPGREPPTERQLGDLVAFLHTIDSDTRPVDDPHEPNDTPEVAVALSPGTTRGLVADGVDWWSVEVTEPTTVHVQWTDVGAPLRVTLHPAEGEARALTEATPLAPGVYRLEVEGTGQAYDVALGVTGS